MAKSTALKTIVAEFKDLDELTPPTPEEPSAGSEPPPDTVPGIPAATRVAGNPTVTPGLPAASSDIPYLQRKGKDGVLRNS